MFTTATECGGRYTGVFTPARWTTDTADPAGRQLQAMAEILVPRALAWPGLIDLTRRRWELLASSDTFEAWVIGWPPGGTIALHDHGDAAGAVAVARGELVETLVAERVDGSVTTATRRMAAGTSWTMARRHVHDIVNDASTPAVSVHVYAPRLTTMTQYRIADGVLLALGTEHYRQGILVP